MYSKEYKSCTKCQQEKPRSEFYHHGPEGKYSSGKCKPCHNAHAKQWAKANPLKCSVINKRARSKRREYYRALKRQWYKENKRRVADYVRKQRHESVQLRVYTNMGNVLRYALRRRLTSKGGRGVFDVLPYDLKELMAHLEKLFKPGMTWKNYGKWHIDHVVPDCHFKYTSIGDPQFHECWKLENLQPLWALENHSKGGRI